MASNTATLQIRIQVDKAGSVEIVEKTFNNIRNVSKKAMTQAMKDQRDYWQAYDSFQKKSAVEVMKSEKAKWAALGVRSKQAIDDEIALVKRAAAEKQAIYAKGSREWERIENAKNAKLKQLNNEMVGHHEASMAAMTRAVFRFYAAWYVAQASLSGLKNFVMDGVKAIDDMKISSIAVAAQLTTMQGTTGDIVENYRKNVEYAKALIPVLQQVDAASLASFEQIQAMHMAMTMVQGPLNINSSDQVKAFTALTNIVSLYAQGADKMKQARQEIGAIFRGETKQSDLAAKAIDEQIKRVGVYKDGLKGLVEEGRKHGDTLQRLKPYLIGIEAATGDISETWEAVGSSIDTAFGMIQRELFKDLYKDLIIGGQKAVEWTKANAAEIADTIKRVSKDIAVGLFAVTGYLAASSLAAIKWGGVYLAASNTVIASNSRMVKSFGIFTALIAGWEFGKWLSDEYEEARLAGIAFVDGTMKAFYKLERVSKLIWVSITEGWSEAINGMRSLAVEWLDGLSNDLQKLPFTKDLVQNIWEVADGIEAGIKPNEEYRKKIAGINAEYGENIKNHQKIIDLMVEESSLETNRPKFQKPGSAPYPNIPGGVDLAALEAEEQARKQAADAAQKQAEKIADVIANLQWELSIVGMAEEEQAALNSVRSAGAELASKEGQQIYNLTKQLDAEKKAIQERNAEWEKYKDFMSDDQLNQMSIDLHEGEVEAQENNLKSMEEYTSRYSEYTTDIAENTETAWVKAAENIQDAWAGLFSDILTGELSGFDQYAKGLGDTLASAVSNNLVAGITKAMQVASQTGTSALPGIMGALGSVNPWMIGGAVGLSALSSYLGKEDKPSYGERLAEGIEKMVEALQENTKTLLDQIKGSSDLEIAVKGLSENFYTLKVDGMNATAAESFKIPEGMKQRDREFMDGLQSTIAAGFAMVTGGASLAAIPKVLDKGYTSYDYSKAETSDIIQQLAERMGLQDFLTMMRATTQNAGALIDALRDNDLLNGEIPERVLEYYSGGGGSKDDRNRKAAGLEVAQLENDMLKVGLAAQNVFKSIDAYVSSWDSRNITEFAAKMAEVDETLGGAAKEAKAFFTAMMGEGYDLSKLADEAGPTGNALLLLMKNTGLTKEEIMALVDAEETWKRITGEVAAEFAAERQKTIDAMKDEMTVMSGMEKQYQAIDAKAEQYRQTLVDNGMSVENAANITARYAQVISAQALATQQAADRQSLLIQLYEATGQEEKALELQRKQQIKVIEDLYGAGTDAANAIIGLQETVWDFGDAAKATAEKLAGAMSNLTTTSSMTLDFLGRTGETDSYAYHVALLQNQGMTMIDDMFQPLVDLMSGPINTLKDLVIARNTLTEWINSDDIPEAVGMAVYQYLTTKLPEPEDETQDAPTEAANSPFAAMEDWFGSFAVELPPIAQAFRDVETDMEGFRTALIEAGETVPEIWGEGGAIETAVKQFLAAMEEYAIASDIASQMLSAIGDETTNEQYRHWQMLEKIQDLAEASGQNYDDLITMEGQLHDLRMRQLDEEINTVWELKDFYEQLADRIKSLQESISDRLVGLESRDDKLGRYNTLMAEYQALDPTSETYFERSTELLEDIYQTGSEIFQMEDTAFAEMIDIQRTQLESQLEALETQKESLEKQINTLQQIEAFLWDLTGGSLAPVQSAEGMMNQYQKLLGEAAATQDTSKLEAFIKGDFFSFFKDFGNYKDINAMVVSDITNLGLDFSGGATLDDLKTQLETLNATIEEINSQISALDNLTAPAFTIDGMDEQAWLNMMSGLAGGVGEQLDTAISGLEQDIKDLNASVLEMVKAIDGWGEELTAQGIMLNDQLLIASQDTLRGSIDLLTDTVSYAFMDKLPVDQIITTAYQNLFGRTPDEAGLDWWSDQLKTGAIAMSDLQQALISGAQGPDMDYYNAHQGQNSGTLNVSVQPLSESDINTIADRIADAVSDAVRSSGKGEVTITLNVDGKKLGEIVADRIKAGDQNIIKSIRKVA